MANAATIGSIMWEVLNEGKSRILNPSEIESFNAVFHADVAEKIEEIRIEQRRAYDEERNLILS